MPIDFIEDEDEAPDSAIDFTPDTAPVVAPSPSPIVADNGMMDRAAKRADLLAQQQAAGRQGEYWRGIGEGIGNISDFVVEPLSRGISGTFGRAADALINVATGQPQVGAGEQGLTERAFSAPTINLPKLGEAETPLGKIGAGTYNAATDLIAGLSSPEALAMLPAAANKTVLTGWVSQMAGHTPERVIRATELFKDGKTQEAVQEVAAGLGEIGMAEMGRRHVMGDALRPRMADVTDATIDPRAAQETALEATNPRNAQRVVLPETLRELSREPSIPKPNAIPIEETATSVRGVPEQPGLNEPLSAEKGGGEVPPGTIPPGDAQGAPRAEEARPAEVPLKEVTVKARTPEGEEISLKMDAGEAQRRFTQRKTVLEALRDCMG